MAVTVDDSRVDLFPLPDAPLLFGVNGRGRHAVERTVAVEAIGDGLIRDASPWSVCGERVGIAAKWGGYERSSLYLNQGKSANCARCTWIVASAKGELAIQIDAERPKPDDLALFAAALGDPLVGVRVLEAIAADTHDELVDRDDEFGRSPRSDLLALASRHQPAVLVCEECAEGSDRTHGDEPCPSLRVACMGCTAKAGPWAGEWEGHCLPQCLVMAPCSVLRAFADYYKIQIGQ